MRKEYRILPVRYPLHGLKHDSLLSDIMGYELYRRENIKLVSMGVFNSEEDAKAVARKNAAPGEPVFV